MINYLSKRSSNLQKINNAFALLDEDNTGYVCVKKLQEQIPDLTLDMDEDAQLEYSEFLSRALDVKKEITKEDMKLAFEHLDCDKTGKINTQDLSIALEKHGKKVPKSELSIMIQNVDRQSLINTT